MEDVGQLEYFPGPRIVMDVNEWKVDIYGEAIQKQEVCL